MQIARGSGLLALMLVGAGAAMAQEGTAESEARSRELSERMRVTLEQQSRVLSQMQRDLERASKADPRVRDSIVRSTSQRISELAMEIARVQMEADRVQRQSIDAEARAQLRAQIASARALGNVTRALAGQQRALTFMSSRAPRGYLGVTLTGVQNTELRDGKVYTLYESPLSIELVVPDSPAARAGLQAGDTILAFGRLTLPAAVPLTDLLTPGEKLPVKIRRGGRDRTVTVTVGDAQPGARAMTLAELPGLGTTLSRACSGDDCTVSINVSPRSAPAAPAAVSPTAPARYPDAPSPPSVPGYRYETVWASSDGSVAGAVMTTITEDLEALTGTDEGILVLRVAPGTPAASSGLRGGDVIKRINDEDCEGVRDLQRALQRASSRGVRQVALQVIRQKREQSITLHW